MLYHTEDNIANPRTVYKEFKVNMKEWIKSMIKIHSVVFQSTFSVT